MQKQALHLKTQEQFHAEINDKKTHRKKTYGPSDTTLGARAISEWQDNTPETTSPSDTTLGARAISKWQDNTPETTSPSDTGLWLAFGTLNS